MFPVPFLLLCSSGVKKNSIDSLVFDTLIPKPIIQRYLNLLMEHRRIILSGPSGTGKSFLAAKLAEYIISHMGQEVTEHNVASFNVDQNSSKVRATEVFFKIKLKSDEGSGSAARPAGRSDLGSSV